MQEVSRLWHLPISSARLQSRCLLPRRHLFPETVISSAVLLEPRRGWLAFGLGDSKAGTIKKHPASTWGLPPPKKKGLPFRFPSKRKGVHQFEYPHPQLCGYLVIGSLDLGVATAPKFWAVPSLGGEPLFGGLYSKHPNMFRPQA